MTIDGVALVQEPTKLKEYKDRLVVRRRTANHSLRVHRGGDKVVSLMKWTMLTPAEYQAVLAQFGLDTLEATEITLHNPNSRYGNITITAIAEIEDEDEYYKGGDYMADLSLIVQEV